MSEDKLQKRLPEAVKEKTQYALAFGVIATMLFVAGFPMFIIIFFGIFAYFLWKTFASPSPNGTREVFEFYLAANEILRDDDRRWFGFEMQETIARGERILQMMNGAPPLVYFTLGALYHKAGDHKSAVNHLAYILENENADEKTYLYASPELKNYVKILRKIEREPAEAPQTSAAIRALERARRNRGKALLEESRRATKEQSRKKREIAAEQRKQALPEANRAGGNGAGLKAPASITAAITEEDFSARERIETPSPQPQILLEPQPPQPTPQPQMQTHHPDPAAGPQPQETTNGAAGEPGETSGGGSANATARKQKTKRENFSAAQRQPITEVLRDIYDEK